MDAFLASFLLRVSLAAWLPLAGAVRPPIDVDVELTGEALGRSGALRALVAMPGHAVAVEPRWTVPPPDGAWYRWVPDVPAASRPTRPLGTGTAMVAPAEPGAYTLQIGWDGGGRAFPDLTLLVLVPADEQVNGRLRGYRIGSYPQAADRYAPPRGFIEVTRDRQHLQVSEHFRLREFLTHDQADAWPKFVLIDPMLLDKLELLMAELEAGGVPARHMIVMSGFRTPQYNRKGLSQGRAELSRHQYGDAADVWIDNDGDWYIDDLNRDGRRDTRDVRVMLEAIERVERRHPELLGGAGVYDGNGAHGPFLHVDVRGRRARW